MTVRFFCLILSIVLVGCIPAHVPDNLDDTPGPPVMVSDGFYVGMDFQARIPDGWRVITGEARATQSAIFVAPDDKTLIRLVAGKVDVNTLFVDNQRNYGEVITLAKSGQVVTAVFSSPYSTWERYYPLWEQVRDSFGSR